MMQSQVIGFYGKLPILETMISKGLPQSFILPWNQWLQDSMLSSQRKLGDKWLDLYLNAPIWRFILTPKLGNDAAWMGIMLPSMDKMGNYFPFSIVIKIPSIMLKIAPLQLLDMAYTWYSELENIASLALEQELSLDDLEALLADTPNILYNKLLTQHNYKLNTFSSTNFSLEHSFWQVDNLNYHIKLKQKIFTGLPPANEFDYFFGQPQLFKEMSNIKTQTDLQNIETELKIFNQHYPENNLSASIEQRADILLCKSYALTDKGMCRTENQDAFLERPDLGLWVVADGLGGHKAGDVANRMVIHALNKLILLGNIHNNITQIQECLAAVNAKLIKFSENLFNQQIIASTVVVLLKNPPYFTYLWAGDSRLYLLREGQLSQLSTDHSEYQGINKKSHVITRAVGAHAKLTLDQGAITKIYPRDVFLLCSDGLNNELSEIEIKQALQQHNYLRSVNDLMKFTLQREAKDNVTIMVVEIL